MLIKFAFAVNKSSQNGNRIKDLDWPLACFADKEAASVLEGRQFAQILECISQNLSGDLNEIMTILRKVQNATTLFELVKKKVGPKILDHYREHFVNKCQTSSYTSYHRVIREMCDAKENCKKYVDDGHTLFQTVVVQHILDTHQRKKKLVRLLRESFPFNEALDLSTKCD